MTTRLSSDFPARVFVKHTFKMSADCYVSPPYCGRKIFDAFSDGVDRALYFNTYQKVHSLWFQIVQRSFGFNGVVHCQDKDPLFVN